MGLILHPFAPPALLDDQMQAWRGIPAAIASDELNRAGAMDAGMRCFSRKANFVGPAATVHTVAGDNLAIHHAVSMAPAGVVLAIDAGGHDRNAVWGGILHRAAEVRGIVAVIVDGCIRDLAEIRESAVACFARGVVPSGPHKGWGGSVNAPVQVGRCVVRPGDLVLGDEDGVVVIPPELADALHARCLARMAAESTILDRIAAGETTVSILGLEAH